MHTVGALVLVAVALSLPSTAHALPFMPDYLDATSLAVRFVETGTDTACVNCEDPDPSNDLTLTLGPFGGGGVGGGGNAVGSISMTGHLLSIRDALLAIEANVRVVSFYGIGSFPEELAAYPLPSVIYGTLYAHILGADAMGWTDGFDFVEDGYWGEIGGAMFKSAGGPSIRYAGEAFAFNGEVHWGEMPYTPEISAVPEPTTLLLLGSGLIGAEWKRRRRHT